MYSWILCYFSFLFYFFRWPKFNAEMVIWASLFMIFLIVMMYKHKIRTKKCGGHSLKTKRPRKWLFYKNAIDALFWRCFLHKFLTIFFFYWNYLFSSLGIVMYSCILRYCFCFLSDGSSCSALCPIWSRFPAKHDHRRQGSPTSS